MRLFRRDIQVIARAELVEKDKSGEVRGKLRRNAGNDTTPESDGDEPAAATSSVASSPDISPSSSLAAAAGTSLLITSSATSVFPSSAPFIAPNTSLLPTSDSTTVVQLTQSSEAASVVTSLATSSIPAATPASISQASSASVAISSAVITSSPEAKLSSSASVFSSTTSPVHAIASSASLSFSDAFPSTISTLLTPFGTTVSTSLSATSVPQLITTTISGTPTTFLTALAESEAQSPLRAGNTASITAGVFTNGFPDPSSTPGIANITETETSNSGASKTTMAISISVIIAGVIAISLGTYFGLRRVIRRRRIANAESPPSSPLLTSLAMPSPLPSQGSRYYDPSVSSLSRGNSQTSSYGGARNMYDEKDLGLAGDMGVIREQEVGYRGIMGTEGPLEGRSLSPLPPLAEPKFSMIFPNDRVKLGGAPLPKDF